MNPYENKITPEKTSDFSDAEIINFLDKNSADEGALTRYFLGFKKPISINVLLNKMRVQDGEPYNFLIYAALKLPICFNNIVSLATPNAINMALSEIPGKSVCPAGFTIILISGSIQALKNPPVMMHEGILNLIQKADDDVLNACLNIRLEETVPLIKALLYPDAAVALQILHKVNDYTIKETMQEVLPGTRHDNSFFKTLIDNRVPIEVWSAMLKRLERLDANIIDPLRLWVDGNKTPLLHQLSSTLCPEISESYICLLQSHLSPATQKIISRQAFLYSKIQNLLANLMAFHASEKTIDSIFSLMGKHLFNELALLNGDSKLSVTLFILENCIKRSLPKFQGSNLEFQSNSTSAIIKHLDKDTLIALMKQPICLDALRGALPNFRFAPIITKIGSDLALYKTEMVFLDLLSNDYHVFNSYLRKILLEGDYIELSSKAISCLDEENLGFYTMQQPEMPITPAQTFKEKDKESVAFEARLQKSTTLLTDNMALLLMVNRELENISLSTELIKIVINYLGIDKAYMKCMELETIQEKHSEKLVKLTSIYSEITHYFLHTLALPFRTNEGLVVLMYLTKRSQLAEIAIRNFHMKKTDLSLVDTVKISSKILTRFTAFWKEEDPKETVCKSFKKLEIAKQDIDKFVKEQNLLMDEKPESRREPGTPLRTFLELEHYFQLKDNNKFLIKIKTLQKGMLLANTQYHQACLGFILKDFAHPKIRPWAGAKKLLLMQVLTTEAQDFGFEYKIQNNNGFLQAIIQQLALQKLSRLASSDGLLYTKMKGYLQAHPHEYKVFLDKYGEYLNHCIEYNLELGAEFAQIMILTCSRVLNVNIVLITGDGTKPHLFKQPMPLGTLCLGQLSQDYYSLIENKALPKTKLLQDWMEEVILDFADDCTDESEVHLHFSALAMTNS